RCVSRPRRETDSSEIGRRNALNDGTSRKATAVSAVTGVAVELGNLQGLVHERYPCPLSRYLLFKIKGGDGRRFLRELLPLVTAAGADVSSGQRLLNIGLSFDGLRALGIADDILNEFPLDFSD